MLSTSVRSVLALCLVLAACEKKSSTPPDTSTEDASAGDDGSATPEGDADDADGDGDEPAASTSKAPPVERLLEIDGPLTADAINATKKAHIQAIEECFNQAFEDPDQDENFKGAVVIAFTVTERGKVSGAKVEVSEFGFQPTELCLATLVDSFEFAKQKKPSTVHLPFYANEF